MLKNNKFLNKKKNSYFLSLKRRQLLALKINLGRHYFIQLYFLFQEKMCALVIKKQSERIFHKINGLICIYKPPSMKLNEVSQKLKYMFVKTLNDLPCRSIKKMVKIDDENNKIYITKNLADSPLGSFLSFEGRWSSYFKKNSFF